MTRVTRAAAQRRLGLAAVVLAVAVTGVPDGAFAQDAAKGVADKAQICAGCHGEKDIPIDTNTPVIWGQHAGYIYLQLRDFKSGARKSDIMGPIAQGLERDDMLALGELFEQRKWPNLVQPAPAHEAVVTAARANNAIGCTGCHQSEYQGDGTQPRLAGQRREYLERTMLDFRSGKRGNNPGMTDLMKAASTDDIAAMAQYLAGF